MGLHVAIFADLATLAIAYDRAPYASKPVRHSLTTHIDGRIVADTVNNQVEWQLPKLWILSTLMGLLLAGGEGCLHAQSYILISPSKRFIGTWIVRGTLFLNNGGIIENFGNVQEVM